jgi:hypothetical protein
MLLQETMGDGSKIVVDLGKLLGEWNFEYIDARGHSCGLIIGCFSQSPLFTNSMSCDLGLRTFLYSQELGRR